MKKHYKIKITEDSNGVIYLPANLSHNINLKLVAFGSSITNAKFLINNKSNNFIVISKDIFNKLKLPFENKQIHLFINNDTIHIGPLVGIITTGFTPIIERPLGDRSYFFEKLLALQNETGIISFIFSEQHINWKQGVINGYFFENNKWVRYNIPLPNVIYDRIPNRRAEKILHLNNVKQKLQFDYLVPWFNQGFFNKITIYNHLKKNKKVRKYIPKTQLFSSKQTLKDMLKKHKSVYVKPINGSHGNNIYQIIYDKNENLFLCRYNDKYGTNYSEKYSTIEDIMNNLFLNINLEEYIIQESVKLLNVDGLKVDFRVHTNKNEAGVWDVTAIAAKLIDPKYTTTHIKNGGTVRSIRQLFKDEEKQFTYKNKLSETALHLSNVLENELPGFIGEIGFDLGIDYSGNVFLFEANSKPGRSIFVNEDLNDYDYLTRKAPLSFSVFLTEQAIKQPELIINKIVN